jgi:putative transposase
MLTEGDETMPQQSDTPNQYHRHSIRLPDFDYTSNGAYFITLCTLDRQPHLIIPELRAIIEDTWQSLPQRFPAVLLDDFMIMPDHVHFIVWLNAEEKNDATVSEIVGAYKSLTIHFWLLCIRANGYGYIGKFWQRNFYEHIIKSEFELQQIRAYIRNNPTVDDLKKRGYEQ